MKKQILSLLFIQSFISLIYAQVEIGDGGTNFTEFEVDGTMEFHGDATVYDDLVVAFSTGKTASNPPTFAQFVDDGSGSVGVYAYRFDDEAANNEAQVFFTIQMPHSWIEGTDVYPHIHWAPEDNTSGTVVWGMEYSWVEYNSTTPLSFPSSTIITTTSNSLANDANKHMITPFASITPSISQDNISSILVVRLFRNSSNVSDTYTGGAFGLSFDLHIEKNTAGSRNEWTK